MLVCSAAPEHTSGVATATSRYGTLRIQANPRRCRIEIPSIAYVDSTHSRNPIVVDSVPAGEVEVAFYSSGTRATCAYRVFPGEVTYVKADLLAGGCDAYVEYQVSRSVSLANITPMNQLDSVWLKKSDSCTLDTPPEMVRDFAPQYPPLAKAKQLDGTVWVKAAVDEYGQVRAATVGQSSGVDMLDSAAVSMAPFCRFVPAMCDGHPMKCWVSYRVVFVYQK